MRIGVYSAAYISLLYCSIVDGVELLMPQKAGKAIEAGLFQLQTLAGVII